MCHIESLISIIFCTLNLILMKGRISVLKTTFRAVKNSIHYRMGFLMEANMLPNSSFASQKGRLTVIPYDSDRQGNPGNLLVSHILSPEWLKIKISINFHKWGVCPTRFMHLNMVVLFIHWWPKRFLVLIYIHTCAEGLRY